MYPAHLVLPNASRLALLLARLTVCRLQRFPHGAEHFQSPHSSQFPDEGVFTVPYYV